MATSRDEEQRGAPRVGTLINEDHPRHALVYIMILGIRTAVSQVTYNEDTRELTADDAQVVERWKFLSDGTPKTPAHKHADFKFQDYAPATFAAIRATFFSESDYLLSLTQDNVLSELSSPGKSGSFFYFTSDLRYVIKTISHSEAKLLRKILHKYHLYVRNNPNTLLSRFCGLHRLKPHKGDKTYFVIMHNVFQGALDIHRKFDLKGSTTGRTAGEAKLHQEGAVLKDLDFLRLGAKIRLGPRKRTLFLEQLERDIDFLRAIRVMDYSLLVGIHDLNRANTRAIRPSQLQRVEPAVPELPDRAAIRRANLKKKARRRAKRALTQRPVTISRVNEAELPVVASGTSIFEADQGGFQATDANNRPLCEIYFLGVIDFLQPYNVKKKLEHKYKSIRYDKSAISAVPPHLYARRFLSFANAAVLVDSDASPFRITGPRALVASAAAEAAAAVTRRRRRRRRRKHPNDTPSSANLPTTTTTTTTTTATAQAPHTHSLTTANTDEYGSSSFNWSSDDSDQPMPPTRITVVRAPQGPPRPRRRRRRRRPQPTTTTTTTHASPSRAADLVLDVDLDGELDDIVSGTPGKWQRGDNWEEWKDPRVLARGLPSAPALSRPFFAEDSSAQDDTPLAPSACAVTTDDSSQSSTLFSDDGIISSSTLQDCCPSMSSSELSWASS